MLHPSEFPTRQNCDPNEPSEFALWAFVALPGVNGAPLIMPMSYYRLVSQRLWDLGFRQVEEPTLEWVPPTASDPNWITSPGKWVPAGSVPKPSDEEQAQAAMTRMTGQQKAELLAALEQGMTSGVFPDSPSGRVAESLSARQRQVVLQVLREQKGGEA